MLPFERAKGKIIILSTFISTVEDKEIANRFSGRNNTKELYRNSLKFSTIFFIKNYYKNNFISNTINIQDISRYKKEKEHLFQSFSFYYVKDVIVDLKNFTADIYLETIGKKEILEEKIKKGMEIEYNQEEKIIQIKKS